MNYLDLFSGIGGFHKGLTDAGHEFDWVGFSEIDKYATSVYKKHYGEANELGDIKSIQLRGLPDKIELLTAGFPCQSFSIAGKRRGFNDTRGALFFEIARILRYFKEHKQAIPYFILENVKGLLSSENGQIFITIYGILTDLGYTVECQVLNTRWFLPQNRERIFIIGCLRELGRPQVFPIGESDEISTKRISPDGSGRKSSGESFNCLRGCGEMKIPMIQGVNNPSRGYEPRKDGLACTIKAGESGTKNLVQIGTIGKGGEAMRVYDSDGIARTIKDGGGMGAKTGLYAIRDREKQIIHTNKSGMSTPHDEACALRSGASHNYQVIAVKGDLFSRKNPERQNRIGDTMFTLRNTVNHAVMIQRPHGFNKGGEKELPSLRGSAMEQNDFLKQNTSIRRLTPVECERLQGFPDGWTKYGKDGELISDTQRYKMCGNAVSVPVVKSVGVKLKNRI